VTFFRHKEKMQTLQSPSQPRRFRQCSDLERFRSTEVPHLPQVLKGPVTAVRVDGPAGTSLIDPAVKSSLSSLSDEFVQIKSSPFGRSSNMVPSSIGVLLTGDPSPAAGTENIILGVQSRTQITRNDSRAIGFIDGPVGLMKKDYIDLSEPHLKAYTNCGGAQMLGYKMFKPVTERDAQRIKKNCEELGLNGLVIVGGVKELGQVAQLAQKFEGSGISVVGVLQSPNRNVHVKDHIPITLGFDSARGVLSEVAGNITLDAMSSGKFYHFIRCGSTTITLEVALQIEPTMVLINEEVTRDQKSLKTLILEIADVVGRRKEKWGRRSGVILVADGFVEALHQTEILKKELQELRTVHKVRSESEALERMSAESKELFQMLPADAKHSLLFLNDTRGLPLLPQVEPERLLAHLLQDHFREIEDSSFIARYHHIGVEGRCPVPTQFDATYGWALGHCAACLVQARKNGYVACITDLLQPTNMWGAYGIPFAALLKKVEDAKVPEIERRTLNLEEDPIYLTYKKVSREQLWQQRLSYRQPGPTQFDLGKGRRGHTKLYSNCLDYSYTILAEYLTLPQLMEAVVTHNNSTVLADPEDDLGDAVSRATSKTAFLHGGGPGDFGGPQDRITQDKSKGTHATSEGLPVADSLLASEMDPLLDVVGDDPEGINEESMSALREERFKCQEISPLLESEICMWIPLNPPVVCPKRQLSRMSDVQRRRVQFQPQLPACLSQPYHLCDSNISGICSETKFLEKLFPHIYKLHSVRIESNIVQNILRPPSSSERYHARPHINSQVSVGVSERRSNTQDTAFVCTPPHTSHVSGRGSTSLGRSSVTKPVFRPSTSGVMIAKRASGLFKENSAGGAYDVSDTGAVPLGRAYSSKSGHGGPNRASPSLSGTPTTTLKLPANTSGGANTSVSASASSSIQQQQYTAAVPTTASPTTLNIGVVCLGRETAGIHNIVWGLYDYLQILGGTSKLFGFIAGGLGLLKRLYIDITATRLTPYCNQGGLDLLQRSDYSVTKSEAQMQQVLETCNSLELDGLVVIGGASSHPDTALLAEYFHECQACVRVIGVPASVENDIPFIDQALGYDTACKVFASIIGNLGAHACTTGRTWYFIRVAGRSVSHMAAECALQTHPNLIVLSEEVTAHHLTLADITNLVCDVIETRAENGFNYGVVLIPDGLLAKIPEMRQLLEEVNAIHKSGISMLRRISDLTQYLTPLSHFFTQMVFAPALALLTLPNP